MTSDGDDDGDDWWWWWWRWWWWKKYNFSAWWDPSVWCQTDSWSHRHKNNKHWNGTEMRKMRKVKVVMTVKWKTTGKEQKCFCIQSLFLRCKIEKGPWSPRVKMILVNFCGEIKVKVKWQNKNRTIYSRNEERKVKNLDQIFPRRQRMWEVAWLSRSLSAISKCQNVFVFFKFVFVFESEIIWEVAWLCGSLNVT